MINHEILEVKRERNKNKNKNTPMLKRQNSEKVGQRELWWEGELKKEEKRK